MFESKEKRISIGVVVIASFLVFAGIKLTLNSVNAKTVHDKSLLSRAKSGFTTPQVVPSNLPALPEPYINSVVQGKRQLTVRNTRREPVRLTATIEVSDTAFGNGFLTINQISSKGIAALKGEFFITTNNGDIIRDGWSFSYGGKVYARGEEWKVPVGGPINPIVYSPHRIANIGIRVTGVVFDDKSYWGDEGLVVSQKASVTAKNLGMMAAKIKAECLQMTIQEVTSELSRIVPNPIVHSEWKNGRFDLDPVSYIRFSRLLLDQNKNLKGDYMQKLDSLIESCKKLSE